MTNPAPNPGRIMEALDAYQQTAALKGAIQLEIFTHIADGAVTAAEIAKRCSGTERGVRIVCDYLTVHGFLTKQDDRYGLTQDSAVFLNKRSPAYIGSIAFFLAHPTHLEHYSDVAAVVRNGGAINGAGNMAPDDPIWVEFAKYMAPLFALFAPAIVQHVVSKNEPMKVLDVAAGHGMWGISVARHNPAARIVAVDWANVLEVARENAVAAGVSDRFQTIAGSAFEVDLGSGYDLALIPNFLHHFDPPTIVRFLRKIRTAIKPGGLVVTSEFVPNDDRISPPISATFSFMMLGSTESGDAYTFKEYEQMFREAGFRETRLEPFDRSPQQLILSRA